MTAINLFVFVLLIVMTAFFVATEFAIVKVRTSRIDQLISEGKKGALSAKKVVTHLDEYLSACQLGITVTALGLGWIGEPTFEIILSPVFEYFDLEIEISHVITIAIAFIIVTFIHVVVGELAPKTIAIQKAEKVTLIFAPLIILFYRIMYPFIWFLNGSARVLVGFFGLKPASEHEASYTEEELRLLLAESYKKGSINENEFTYVNNIFEFDERKAKEIMVPRTEMVSIPVDTTIDEVIDLIKNEKYTRYPVVDGDKDNVLGFLNAKEFLTAIHVTDNKDKIKLESLINPVITVIDNVPIHDLLVKMQKERIHIAILIDEYGGTSGLVTAEDILEEIVGEIRDETDEKEIPEIRKIKAEHYIISAKLLIDEVNQLLDTHLSNEEVDTIGGWLMTQNLEINSELEIEEEGYIFKIHESDGNHIYYIEVKKV
ncbi:MAG: hemolysin family protein [Bacillus sp. (in: firmicutes)]